LQIDIAFKAVSATSDFVLLCQDKSTTQQLFLISIISAVTPTKILNTQPSVQPITLFYSTAYSSMQSVMCGEQCNAGGGGSIMRAVGHSPHRSTLSLTLLPHRVFVPHSTPTTPSRHEPPTCFYSLHITPPVFLSPANVTHIHCCLFLMNQCHNSSRHTVPLHKRLLQRLLIQTITS
jgi:hypothetical protein